MDHSEQAVHIFNRLAQQYQEKFMDVGLYKEGLTFFMDHLPNPRAKLLDIACGPGNMAHYLLQHQPQYDLLGIDLAPQVIELAKK
jgi:ubiquinone/menaquinone biosynthesis C-methylase UbiE